VKAFIDAELCTGCELCVETCPEVFEMADDVATVKVDEIPTSAEDSAQEAAEDCPSEAITIEE